MVNSHCDFPCNFKTSKEEVWNKFGSNRSSSLYDMKFHLDKGSTTPIIQFSTLTEPLYTNAIL